MFSRQFCKNSICICFSLFLLSLSSVLMTQLYFQQDIKTKIQNISTLKEYDLIYLSTRYPNWGTNPNPTESQYWQNFTLYTLDQQDGEIHATRSNISKSYQLNFQYQNISFAQGNSGRLNFINRWELKPQSSNGDHRDNIKTINLAADRIFNYDYYAPPQRKIPIVYHATLKFFSNEFLVKFYTLYLMKFFFQYKELVYSSVFQPLHLQNEKADFIYYHSQYGWATNETFINWVELSLKGAEYSLKTKQYEAFITELGLTELQIKNLLFSQSTLMNMITALNGTIKLKLLTSYRYSCKLSYCSNEQLAAFQISSAFLSKDPLFSGVSLNMLTKDLNETLLANFQYDRFCDDREGQFECMSNDNKGQFFNHYFIEDFQQINLIWKNQNNFALIEDQFKIQNGTGQSLVRYVNYLYDEIVSNYDNRIFSWVETNYNYIQNIVKSYQKIFITELYARAFENTYVKKNQSICENYFINDFKKYGEIACQSAWNFSRVGIRRYVQAYFFINQMRSNMYKELNMTYQVMIEFFRNQNISLFAKQFAEIQTIFAEQYQCNSSTLGPCTPNQLFSLQWGSNGIFPNLPSQLFDKNITSINEWDDSNIFNGYNPDYYAVVGKKKNREQCLGLLSSNSKEGIFSMFNLLGFSKRGKEDVDGYDALQYVGKIVMNIGFKGILNSLDGNAVFDGFKSELIEQKQNMSIDGGGAPWMQNLLKIIKTDNKIDIKNNQLEVTPQYDTINTGLYNHDKTREMTKIWGQSTSSSKYIVYRGVKKNQDDKQIPVNIIQKYMTNRLVSGTNILGFHPGIGSGDNLLAYVTQAYQSVVLVYERDVEFEDAKLSDKIKAMRYRMKLRDNEDSNLTFIGLEELNQNSFQLSGQSYAVVEPITGLTLQMQLGYTIKMQPLMMSYILSEQQKPIELYDSLVKYRRQGLSEVEEVTTSMKRKTTFTIIGSAVSGGSLLIGVILVAFYCRNKRKGESQENLLEESSKAQNNDELIESV